MDQLRCNLQELFTITFINTKGISEAEIRKDFSQFGRIIELKMCGYSRVFLKYRKREEAEASLAFPMDKYGSIEAARNQRPNRPPIDDENFNLAPRDARPARRSPRRDETSSYHKKQEGNKQDPPVAPRAKPQYQQRRDGPGSSPLHLMVSPVPQEKPESDALPSYSEMMKAGRPKDFYSLAADDKCEDPAADAAVEQWDLDAAGGQQAENVEPKQKATFTSMGLRRSKSFVDRPMRNRFADASSPQVSASAGAARRSREEKAPARSSGNSNASKPSPSGMRGGGRNRTLTSEPVAPDQGRYKARAKSCHRSYDEHHRGSPERTPAAATVRPWVSFNCAKPASPRDAACDGAGMPDLGGPDTGPPPLVCGARPRPRRLQLVDIPDPARELIAVNVPPGVQSADVALLFQQFGPCRVSLLGTTPQRGLPFCFVRFAMPEQATAALELDDVQFDGCHLLLRRVCDAKKQLQAFY